MTLNTTDFTNVNVTNEFRANGIAVNPSATTAVTPGTAAASKAVVLDANKRVDSIVIGTLKTGAGTGTAVTGSAAQLNSLTDVDTELVTLAAAVTTPAVYTEDPADIAALLVDAGLMAAE